MIVVPVTSSPAMIARSIGAAPRQRGSSDGCTFRISCSLSKGSLISCPKAQTIDDVGLELVQGAPRLRLVHARGLMELEAELARGLGRRRGRQLAAAAAAAVGGSHHQRRGVGAAASRRSTVAANSEVPR